MTYIYGYAAVMLAALVARLYGMLSEQKWTRRLFLGADAVASFATVFMVYTLFSWTGEGFQNVSNALMQLFMMIQGRT